MRTLIVDDEPLAREGMRLRLLREPDVELVGEAADGEEAARAIVEKRPDLVFLDVQMPGKDGFAVLSEVSGTHLPVVVFVTAHDKHALRAFEAHALDYLLKPVSEARLKGALSRARDELRRQDGAFPSRAAALLGGVERPSRIAVPDRGRFLLIRTADITCVLSEGNYVRVNARGGGSYLLRGTLTAFHGRLDPKTFVRIHRTTLVNVEQVAEIRPSPNGDFEVSLRTGDVLRMSRLYRDSLLT